jgi:hypothetical protein
MRGGRLDRVFDGASRIFRPLTKGFAQPDSLVAAQGIGQWALGLVHERTALHDSQESRAWGGRRRMCDRGLPILREYGHRL